MNKSEILGDTVMTKNVQTKSRFVNDTYNKNPIEVLSKDQNAKMNDQQHMRTFNKFNRVSNYLGSDGFKSSNLFYKDETKPGFDKITNRKVDLNRTVCFEEPRYHKKAVNRIFENNRVYYD